MNVHVLSMYVYISAIKAAKPGTRLYGLPPVSDPSNEVVEVLIQCMDWNIATRQKGIPQSDLPDLHQKAVDLLDLLQKNLPDKTGEKGKWNFEKAHSILHKVREIVDVFMCISSFPCSGWLPPDI